MASFADCFILFTVSCLTISLLFVLKQLHLLPYYPFAIAQMAELVDAPDSKSGIGNNVQVRFLFWALEIQTGYR
jgi:hypothetical protein